MPPANHLKKEENEVQADFRARVRFPLRGRHLAAAALACAAAVLGLPELGRVLSRAGRDPPGVPGRALEEGPPPLYSTSEERAARSRRRPPSPAPDAGADADPYDNERSHAIVPGDSMLNSDWGECSAARPRPAKCAEPRPELPAE